MLKRGLVIGSATALALVVLLLTMMAEPSRRSDSDKIVSSKSVIPDAASLANIDPNAKTVRGAQGYRYSRINKHNQLIQGGGDDLVPKPQGVSDVNHPWARIFLTPSRVLEIRAEHGTFVAPDRQPRNGEFQGRVVVTEFDGPADRAVLLAEDSPDVVLRIFMEDARFDLELGHIESQSKVHVTTPRIDFRGTGLDMNYNEVRRRIEHLEVAQGDTLRIKQGTDSPAAGNGGNAAAPTQPATPGTKPGKKRGSTQPAAPQPPQFYRSRLSNQVRIQGPALEAEADELITFFAMNQHGGDQTTNNSPQPSRTARQPAAKNGAPRATQTTQAAEPWLPPDETMAPPGANDIIITWNGPMLVEPQEQPPPDLAGPDDTMMELNGRPMHATIFKRDAAPNATAVVDENITAAHFDYLSKSGRMRLIGSAEYPMVLDSISLGGKLRGPNLVVDQLANVGHVDGPGTLESSAPLLAPGSPDTKPANNGRMPPGMKIAWHDRLDLTFYPRAADQQDQHPPANANEPVRLRALKTAVFRGKATIDHPQFQMAGDQIATAVGDPALGRQTLNSIVATGHARVASLEGAAENRVTIHSDQLTIDMTKDATGGVEPSRLRAWDHVQAELPGKSLESKFLDVVLAPAEPGTAPVTSEGQGSRIAIKSLDAQRNVRVHTNDPMTMTADRMLTTGTDEVELTGLPGVPAVVQRADGTLISRHMLLNQKAQTVRVDGSGVFAFPAKSNNPTTPPAPGAPPSPPPTPDMPLLLRLANHPSRQPPTTLATTEATTTEPGTPDTLAAGPHPDAPLAEDENAPAPDHWSIITWRDSMAFDNLQGVGQFRGAVRVRSRSDNQTNRLRCDDLRLEFASTTGAPSEPGRPGPGTPGNPAPPPAPASIGQFGQGSRSLRTLDIRDHAHFEGETWEGEPSADGSKLLRRITLEGDEMLYTEPAQNLLVPGTGRLLVEDYRPDAPPPAPAPAQAPEGQAPVPPDPAVAAIQPDGPVKFTGNGQTLLLWDGRLTINTARNDLLAEKNVRMIHLAGDGDKTQLFSDRFKIEFESSGNHPAAAADQSQAQLKTFEADQNVHILSRGHTYICDHLRYVAKTQNMRLIAEPDHLVEMTSPNDTNTYTAEEVNLNPATGRIEIVRPGPGRMPTK